MLELEKIPAIATLVELFYVHLKSSTEKLLHFPVNYGDFVAVQVGPQRKLVTVNYSTPSPAA